MTVSNPVRLTGLLLAAGLGALASGPVRAQPPAPHDPAAANDAAAVAMRDSMASIIGIVTFGLFNIDSLGTQLSPEGNSYRIRVPLAAADPPASAVTGIATPAGDGSWNIGQLAFPSAVTLHPPRGEAVYAIGGQSVTAHIDPTLAHPSTWTGTFDDVSLSGIAGPVRTSQHVGHYFTSGKLTPAGAGLVNLATDGKFQDWDFLNSGGPGGPVKATLHDARINVAIAGLDAVKAANLRQHLRAGLPGPSAPDGAAAPPDAAETLLADVNGLLRRVEGKETLRGMTFETRPGPDGVPLTGTIGELTVAMVLTTEDADLDAQMDVGINQMSLSAVPAAYAALMPRNISLRHIVKGIPGARIMALLRAAMSGTAPDALRMQATGLLASPDARVGIDPFSFDAGPLRASGSARLMSGADGSVIGRVHLTATGMDALLSEIARVPALSQLVAGLFLAKGMAKPEGQALVWDIDFGKGPPLVNGVPVGAPQVAR